MDKDQRLDPAAYARRAGIGLAELQSRYGASGLVRCGKATGSGQLTLANNLVTTAAHVFIGKDGRLRSETCVFEPAIKGGAPVAIDMASIRTGSGKPLAELATLDWAVARLAAPVDGVTPYDLGAAVETPSPVFMFGAGNGTATRIGAERCWTRRVTIVSPEGIRELAFDCSAAHGGSGAALINSANEIVGIFIGYRSIDPDRAQPFSELHYNFAITVEGPFRTAVLQAADRPRPER